MWYGSRIMCLLIFFIALCRSMENNSTELSRIAAHLDIIESEATAPNPHAAYRIDDASNKLLACSRIRVAQKWKESCARANATKLVANSKKVMEKYRGTPLEASGEMLYMQAEQIRSAVDLIDEKIKLLK